MKISAIIENAKDRHEISLRTDGNAHSISIPPRSTGYGSSVNGGELLFLALATCYCNDIYREAEKRGIDIAAVEVTVEGEFGAEGGPARDITYGARVTARAQESDIQDLMKLTDELAEIQNTLRTATPVRLSYLEALSLTSPPNAD